MLMRTLGFGLISVFMATGALGQQEPLRISGSRTLDADVNVGIIIEANTLTLDCAGHTVMGNGSGIGIQLIGRVGVTVKNCRVTNFEKGVVLAGSARNLFIENRVDLNADEGFDLNGAIGNLFVDNIVDNNNGDGFDLDDSHENIFKRNDIIRNGRNGVELDFSDNNVFEGNVADSNGRLAERSGFSLDSSNANVFQGNIANNNTRSGFLVENSSDDTFIENRACGNIGAGRGGNDVFQAASFRNIFLDNAFCRDNLPRLPGLPEGFVLPED